MKKQPQQQRRKVSLDFLKNYQYSLVTMKGCHYCVSFKEETWSRFSNLNGVTTSEFDENDFKTRYFEGFPVVLVSTKDNPPLEIGLLDGYLPFSELIDGLKHLIEEYETEKQRPGIQFSVV